MTRIRLGLTER